MEGTDGDDHTGSALLGSGPPAQNLPEAKTGKEDFRSDSSEPQRRNAVTPQHQKSGHPDPPECTNERPHRGIDVMML
jgi:hypothetical protein